MTGLQAGDERRFLDDASACTIEQTHALFALCESGVVDHVQRVIRQRHVDGDVVGLDQQFVQRHAVDLHRLGPTRRQIRIVGHDLHAKRLRSLRYLAADAAEAHDAERLAEKFDAAEFFAVPLARRHAGRGLRHRTSAAQDVGEGEFGSRDRVAGRRVHHHDPALRGSLDIDVVHTDPGATHDFQQRSGRQHLAGDLRLGAHRDGVHIFHEFENLLGRRTIGLHHFETWLLTQMGYSFG